MSFIAQLIAAEAVRLGAILRCPDPDLAPFAADLAGHGCQTPAANWRIACLGDRYRVPLKPAPVQESSDPDSWFVSVGQMEPASTGLWLNPPDHTSGHGWRALMDGISEVLFKSDLPIETTTQLESFGQSLLEDERAQSDWIEQNLVGRTRLMSFTSSLRGQKVFELAPLSTVEPLDGDDARRHAYAGSCVLTMDAPVTVRTPLFRAAGARVILGIHAPRRVDVEPLFEGAVVTNLHERGPHRSFLVEVGASLDFATFALHGRNATLTSVAVEMQSPVGASEYQESEDVLDRYADPLDAFAVEGAP